MAESEKTSQAPRTPPSRWIKCISAQGTVRGVAIQATELVQSIADRHGLEGSGVRALGEAVMGALLISSYVKNGERVNLNIQGSGNVRQALVDAYPDGTVRGYIVQRSGDRVQPLTSDAVGPWGEGLLSVLRTKNQEGEQPYIGTVPLVTGHLAKDLTFYWAQSEQVPSAVGLAVNMGIDGRVFAAGGFLIQALPGASPAEIRLIEQHIQEIGSLAHAIAVDQDPVHLLSQIMQSSAFILVEEKDLAFKCTCSRERVQRALALVGVAELRSMLEEDRQASLRCDFCSQDYVVDEAALTELIKQAESR